MVIGRITQQECNSFANVETPQRCHLSHGNGRIYRAAHHRLADIEKRLHQLKAIQAQWQRRAKTQQLVATENVLSGEVITEGKVRTLAQLFALEYQQLMKEND